MMDLLAEKQALESSHSHLQDLCQKLEAELSLLQKEKAQALEKRSQVRPLTLLPTPDALENWLVLLTAFSRFTELVVTLKCIGGPGCICCVFSSHI